MVNTDPLRPHLIYAHQEPDDDISIRHQLESICNQSPQVLADSPHIFFDVVSGREAEGLADVFAFCDAHPRPPGSPGYVRVREYIGLKWSVPGHSSEARRKHILDRLAASGWLPIPPEKIGE